MAMQRDERRILITGNAEVGLAAAMARIWPHATFASRSTGYDLNNDRDQDRLAELTSDFDVFINNSALWRFSQTLLLGKVYNRARRDKHNLRIACIGSTTDRATGGKDWMYQQEKKALRSYCNSLSMLSVWSGGPSVSLISFGTLSNNQHKHPDRKCMPLDAAAGYVQWVLDAPPSAAVNELSVDPNQSEAWHE